MMVGVQSKWCRQWQSIRRPSFWQSVVLCLLSSRFRRIEHQTRWICTALWPRSVALRIRSLPHEVMLAQQGIGDAAETTASVHALLLDDPPRAVVTIDDEDDLGTDIRMHEELERVKMENSRLRRRCGRLRIKLVSIGEDSREVFNQVCTCQFGTVTRTSLVRLFFSCQLLICMPLLDGHVSETFSIFFSGCTSPIR